MRTWTVTLRTAVGTWSTIAVPAATHTDAVTTARALLGGGVLVSVV